MMGEKSGSSRQMDISPESSSCPGLSTLLSCTEEASSGSASRKEPDTEAHCSPRLADWKSPP